MIENPNSSQGQSGAFVINSIKSQEDMKNNHPEISTENNQALINHSNNIIQQSANHLNDSNLYCKDGSCFYITVCIAWNIITVVRLSVMIGTFIFTGVL